MDPVPFSGEIRFFRPERASGLTVVDVPADLVAPVGGLRQVRVHGRINSVEFVSSTMPAGGGRLALSVSKAMMSAAGVRVGETADFEISVSARG